MAILTTLLLLLRPIVFAIVDTIVPHQAVSDFLLTVAMLLSIALNLVEQSRRLRSSSVLRIWWVSVFINEALSFQSNYQLFKEVGVVENGDYK
jgi:hypothetical protein